MWMLARGPPAPLAIALPAPLPYGPRAIQRGAQVFRKFAMLLGFVVMSSYAFWDGSIESDAISAALLKDKRYRTKVCGFIDYPIIDRAVAISGDLADAAGLEWAGHWKNFREFPHCQQSGIRWQELIRR